MDTANKDPPADQPAAAVQPSHWDVQPTQSWTLDGYPIVDGKYLDLATGQIKVHSGRMMGGPPAIAVYWNNRLCTGRTDQFRAISASSSCSLSEYLIRVGQLLTTGACTIDSLNATTYSVNVVVMSELSTSEFSEALREHRLIHHDRPS